ncbi:DUF6624 domain-containing protein [Streptomyces cinereoruber]|uniref:DUF6624 domain-containing protein n=1 Tax=Streptomyces cinereoruber TaxID=67260 RepID=UPI003686782C
MSADRLSQIRSVMHTAAPQRPGLACELIALARAADERWVRLARTPSADQQVGAGRHVDHTNGAALARRIADYGWPDVPLVGEGGARAAWKIALRADTLPDFQRLASRLMHGAVERGTAPVSQWAHLYDRCLLNSRRAQCYGTQYRLGPGGPERLAVHEPDGLDARRASVGLPPAGLALQRLRERLAAEPSLDAEEYGGAPAVVLADAA